MHIRLLPLLVIALCCLGSPVLAKRRLKAYGAANKFAQNCAHRLDALYTDHYTGALFNEVPGSEGQRVVCNGQCQLDCQSVIKYALRVRSVSLCPAKERLVDCLNVSLTAVLHGTIAVTFLLQTGPGDMSMRLYVFCCCAQKPILLNMHIFLEMQYCPLLCSSTIRH